MAIKKCRYCGAHKGSAHASRCQTRSGAMSYPDSAIYITSTDTSGSASSGGCDTSSTTTTTDSGSCG